MKAVFDESSMKWTGNADYDIMYISVAIRRSGYPIKSFKRGEFVYLSKVS